MLFLQAKTIDLQIKYDTKLHAIIIKKAIWWKENIYHKLYATFNKWFGYLLQTLDCFFSVLWSAGRNLLLHVEYFIALWSWGCFKPCLALWSPRKLVYMYMLFAYLYVYYLFVSIWAATWQNQQMSVRPAKTQISLGICPIWSEFSLCAQ